MKDILKKNILPFIMTTVLCLLYGDFKAFTKNHSDFVIASMEQQQKMGETIADSHKGLVKTQIGLVESYNTLSQSYNILCDSNAKYIESYNRLMETLNAINERNNQIERELNKLNDSH